MSYRLFTDICADLPLHYTQDIQLPIIPMTVTMEDKEYAITADPKDPRAIDISMFYAKLRAAVPAHTAQINAAVYREYFEPALVQGHDILYLAFSSGLSGSYNSACLAVQELKELYPEREIVAVDTLCASLGQGMIVHLAVQHYQDGMGLHELAQFVRDNIQRIHHWVTVDDLSHLRRSGRVSSAAAVFGSMLSIKPIIYVDPQGHLIATDKVQGRKRALKYLVDKMEKEVRDPKEPIMISHGDCEADASYLAGLIKERFGSDVLLMNTISPIIGCHSGPGTVALFFISNEERKP